MRNLVISCVSSLVLVVACGDDEAIDVLDKITMKGDEPVKDGRTFAFHVRRKIDDADGPLRRRRSRPRPSTGA